MYKRKTQDERMAIFYPVESNVDNTLVIKASVSNEKKHYTRTIKDNGTAIAVRCTPWVLKTMITKV